jgi:hypothetical protein
MILRSNRSIRVVALACVTVCALATFSTQAGFTHPTTSTTGEVASLSHPAARSQDTTTGDADGKRRDGAAGVAASTARATEAYGTLPMAFEPNVGQSDERVNFLARGSGYTIFLTSDESVMVFGKRAARPTRGGPSQSDDASKADGVAHAQQDTETAVVRTRLEGANARPAVEGLDPLPGITNYFIGNDPSKWHTNIVSFSKVRYNEIYPGIDAVYYGNERNLEYDFVVSPGSDPAAIRLTIEGADRLSVNEAGELVLELPGGEMRQQAPVIYQEGASGRERVGGGYVLRGDEVSFAVAGYDPSRPLVIDPVLVYSTYLGGSGFDQANAVAVGPTGDAYVTGVTSSTNFPTSGPFQVSLAGGQDFFVTKMSLAGSTLAYSTYIGGLGTEKANDIWVDGAGSAFVTGSTDSIDFPIMTPTTAARVGGTDAFLTKLTAAGSSLVYSTYWGSTGFEEGTGVTVDPTNNAYITGNTTAPNFPTMTPFQAALGGGTDAFMTKFSVAGNSIVYSTYLGSTGEDQANDIAVADDGAVYVTGSTNSATFPTLVPYQAALGGNRDAFLTHFSLAGNALLYSTYLGGSGDDRAFGITLDAPNNAYLTGRTSSTNFPTLAPFQLLYGGGANDAFAAKIGPSGSALIYSTYLGGAGDDQGQGIAIDGALNAFVTGSTRSANFPTLAPLQASLRGVSDAFVTKLNLTGDSALYSTYLGGSAADEGQGIAVDSTGSAYVAGFTESVNFPTKTPFQAAFGAVRDAFVTKIVEGTNDDTAGVYVPSTATWFLRNTNTAGPADLTFTYGPAGAGFLPLKGDWDADGIDTVGLYDPGTSTFFLKNTNASGNADLVVRFGEAGLGYLPLSGDWNGDEMDTIGLFNPATGTVFLRNTNTPGPADVAFRYGPAGAGWTPLAGDWDGEGTDSAGLYDASTGRFYLRNATTAGPADLTIRYGATGSLGLAGDWDGDGVDTIGIYNAAGRTFFLRNTNTTGVADVTFVYGPAGATPLVGNWDGM